MMLPLMMLDMLLMLLLYVAYFSAPPFDFSMPIRHTLSLMLSAMADTLRCHDDARFLLLRILIRCCWPPATLLPLRCHAMGSRWPLPRRCLLISPPAAER